MSDMKIKQLTRLEILRHYSNVADKILAVSRDREVVGAFPDGSYSKRPNIIQYKSDIIEMVRHGVCSFHGSVERWVNPMSLASDNHDKLRIGWDFILDIDSKLGIEEAKLAAELIISVFKNYGIKNYGLKFSGRRGFHLVLPWEMFPKEINSKPLAKNYPNYPKILASFIRKEIEQELIRKLIALKGAKQLMEILEEPPEKISPYYFVEVEKDWGSRHMFRMPFSFNEKTWLVSLPITKRELKTFKPEYATPENSIKTNTKFFNNVEKDEALNLLIDALDWFSSLKKDKQNIRKRKIIQWEKKITEPFFPPCIKNILAGLEDGRKRSLFTLITFLKMMNWSWKDIEDKLFEWNKKNNQPLAENLILGQLRWNQQQKSILPPNCAGDGRATNELFYGFVCKPDKLCKHIKNPVSYPFKKMKQMGYLKKKAKKQKKPVEKIGKIIKHGNKISPNN
ncbi:MAG: hypothetical protein J7J92_00095 [Candidatus Aenigmarchaeota archaeon]|nr:hypothetical protein [Candidatus Aenigmarchaeota archaeon]